MIIDGNGSSLAVLQSIANPSVQIAGDGASVAVSHVDSSAPSRLTRGATGASLLESLSYSKSTLVIGGVAESSLLADGSGRGTMKLRLLTSENFIVPVKPAVGGGCAITYKGKPQSVTYWRLVGVGGDGFETEPVGRLLRDWVETGAYGYAVNYYKSPTDMDKAGRIDRVIVKNPSE